MNQRVSFVFPLLGASVLVLFTACGHKDKTVQAGGTPDLLTVAVAKAAKQQMSRDLVLTAEFRPYQEVDLMAKVSGYVKRSASMSATASSKGSCWRCWRSRKWRTTCRAAQGALERIPLRGKPRARRTAPRRVGARHRASLIFPAGKRHEAGPGLVAQQEIDDAQRRTWWRKRRWLPRNRP